MQIKIAGFLFTILFCILSTGCGDQKSDKASIGSGGSPPVAYKSAIESIPQSSTNYLLLRLDGITPIDGTENSILVCTSSKKEYCVQTCISIYRPDIERWSVFKTDYLNGGKCVAYALAYPDGQTVPRTKYWLGNYIQNAGQVTGSCVVNVGSPTSEGKSFFSFVRPQNSPSYYLHSFFDNSENLTGSVRLLNFLPPAMWTYHDGSVTNADITPQLVSGFSCVKESEVGNAF